VAAVAAVATVATVAAVVARTKLTRQPQIARNVVTGSITITMAQ